MTKVQEIEAKLNATLNEVKKWEDRATYYEKKNGEQREVLAKALGKNDDVRSGHIPSFTELIVEATQLRAYQERTEATRHIDVMRLENENAKLWHIVRSVTGDKTLPPPEPTVPMPRIDGPNGYPMRQNPTPFDPPNRW